MKIAYPCTMVKPEYLNEKRQQTLKCIKQMRRVKSLKKPVYEF